MRPCVLRYVDEDLQAILSQLHHNHGSLLPPYKQVQAKIESRFSRRGKVVVKFLLSVLYPTDVQYRGVVLKQKCGLRGSPETCEVTSRDPQVLPPTGPPEPSTWPVAPNPRTRQFRVVANTRVDLPVFRVLNSVPPNQIRYRHDFETLHTFRILLY